jgi:hypothetical protein
MKKTNKLKSTEGMGVFNLFYSEANSGAVGMEKSADYCVQTHCLRQQLGPLLASSTLIFELLEFNNFEISCSFGLLICLGDTKRLLMIRS